MTVKDDTIGTKNFARLYAGVPIADKMHRKEGQLLIIGLWTSFQPILSVIGTPTYNLEKFLVPILSPLTVNEFTVHDSFLFAEEVVNLTLTVSWQV